MTSDEQSRFGVPYPQAMEPILVTDLLWTGVRDTRAHRPLGSCLGELVVATMASGGPVPAMVRDHLIACPSCRGELASVIVVRADPAVAAELARARVVRFPRRLAWPALAAAAALAVVVLGKDLGNGTRNPVTRDPAAVDVAMPRVVGPVGAVAAGTPFVWHAVPEASAYQVTIFDSTGAIIHDQRVLDTTLVLPDSSAVAPGGTYDWVVESRTGWDHWTAAPPTRIRILPRTLLPGGGAVPDSDPSPESDDVTSALPPTDPALDARVRAGTVDPRTTYRLLLPTADRDSIALDRLVASYERTTGDPFLRIDLARFRGWSAPARATRVSTDSIRVAGVDAFGTSGPRSAIAVWQVGIRLAAAMRDSAAEGALRGNVGAALSREGIVAGARHELERARRLGQGVGDSRVVANALSELAGLEEQAGSTSRARALYADAIALRARTADRRGLASDHNNLALLLRAEGHADLARRHLERARRANRELGRTSAEATNLVNLAGLAIAAGESHRANDDLDEALSLWREAGDSAAMASAWLGLAELAVQRGAHADAVLALEAALHVLERTGPVPDELIARQRLAAVLVGQGRIQAARDAWETYLDRRTKAGVSPEVEAALELGDGDLAAQFQLPEVALAAYRRAVAHYSELGHDEGLGAARLGLARLLTTRGDTREAAVLFQESHREQTKRGDVRGAALTRIELGELSLERGEVAIARQHFSAADVGLARVGDPVGRALALAGLARIESRNAHPDVAEAILSRATALLNGGQAPELSWRLTTQLAEVRQTRGDVPGARQALRSSLATLDSLRAPIRVAADRTHLRDDAAKVYAHLARLELAAGQVAAAFAASEGGRAREMAAMLDRGRVDAPPDASGRLMEREQELRFQLAALNRDSAAATLATRSTVRTELADVRRALQSAAPRYAALLDEVPVAWQDVSRRLRVDEVMLEYLVTDSATIVFVIRKDGIRALTLPVDARRLAARVTFARSAIESPGNERWAAPMRELYQILVAPIDAKGLLRDARRLVIVPHAILHYLPFAALRSDPVQAGRAGQFLVERFVIQTAPSASVWAHDAAPRGAAGLGALALAPAPRALPASRGELSAVSAGAGGSVHRLAGSAATEAAFRQDAGRQRVLHLATFGSLNRANPLFSHLQLGSGGGHDGRLEVHEIFGLRLAADLVVLSACQTALATGPGEDVPAGDDVVGLARAFLAAGARNVVGSLWAVEDGATAELMEHFYRSGGVNAPADALAAAQRRLVAGAAMRHPWHWSGFVAIGGANYAARAIAAAGDVPLKRSSQ